ncbi:MAG: twin-arginine translocase subunit TatC, partial [Trichodesmium sp. MAG_R04]|nr:twin-arginine translocase subunit TatC [Trichodesmium sp. MAG_R04]
MTPSEDLNNNNLAPISLKEPEIISDKVSNIAEQDLDDRHNSEKEEDDDYLNQVPDEVEMSIFEHLEELRMRIFYSLIAVVVGIIGCFILVKPIVKFLEIPAQGVRFLQLAPGEYFFVTIKVAAYSGILLASPFILYQIVKFVLPGLTTRERRFLRPIFLGSTVLFGLGLVFAYLAIVPAALKFFIGYGSEVVEQA